MSYWKKTVLLVDVTRVTVNKDCQRYHQLVKMKLCVSHYRHKSTCSFSIFGDIDVIKISLWKRERVIEFGYLPPENGFNLKKVSFMSRIDLLDQTLTPMSISAIFKQRKIFSFPKFLRRLDEKRAAATPPPPPPPPQSISFAKIWSEDVLKIKTKSHKIWEEVSEWQL